LATLQRKTKLRDIDGLCLLVHFLALIVSQMLKKF